jgi:hypothetical protein
LQCHIRSRDSMQLNATCSNVVMRETIVLCTREPVNFAQRRVIFSFIVHAVTQNAQAQQHACVLRAQDAIVSALGECSYQDLMWTAMCVGCITALLQSSIGLLTCSPCKTCAQVDVQSCVGYCKLSFASELNAGYQWTM